MTALRHRSLLLAAAVAAAVVAGFVWTAAGPAPLAAPRTTGGVAVEVDAPQPQAQAAPRVAEATARGFWTAPVGARFRYALADRTDVRLASAEGGEQSAGSMHTKGEIAATVVARRGDEILVRCSFAALQFLGADGRALPADPLQASFAAAASAPVDVRFDRVGCVRGYGFAADLDGDQRNFLRGTLGLLVAEVPIDGVSGWNGTGQDTTGTFTARHDVRGDGADEVVVHRTRLAYTQIVGQAELPRHELRGGRDARFDLARGWLVGVQLDEGLALTLPLLDLRAITARRAEVTLLAADHVALDLDVAAAWAAATAGATAAGESLGAHAAANERRLWQQRLHGTTLAALLGDLQALLAAQPVDHAAVDGAFQRLQWLLRLDDRAVAALANELTARTLGDEVARVAVASLGAAGTTPAQDALVALRGDAGAPPALREAATLSCLQLGAPNANVLDSLSAEAVGDSPQRGTSLLVFGALAPRAGQALADGRSPVTALLAMEPTAAARGELDTWLLAVANAGAPQTLAIAMRLFDHESAAVRGACCVAIRSLPAPAALEALLQRGLADAVSSVRHEAVLALSRRSESAARAAIEQAAASDPDAGVRDRAQRLLQRG